MWAWSVIPFPENPLPGRFPSDRRGMGVLFLRMPTAYLPDEDQGIMLAQVIMPTGATLEQTQEVVRTDR